MQWELAAGEGLRSGIDGEMACMKDRILLLSAGVAALGRRWL
jgi:hypothetical protein